MTNPEWIITDFLLTNRDTIIQDMMRDHIVDDVITDAEKVDYLIRQVTFYLPINYEEASLVIDQAYLKKIGF